ncbi:MAG: hypothetical protein A2X70_04750 [Alphaproteobacteria bacterium GWC2_42_16]|nr:MAG: hypothetical protein A2X70_04750 [Alphaproteobacteria bacterium GWC2_42_16]OFW73296.1 MAG: hypothetical protein A2Z80_03930 [Alphaproteobacteria bacterium GWA2_41_27]OFW81870.1 MAG: hypothetical protein A3E50_07110 [Alphaproteobacteria bacterium RIFCSPHIGHO2_12_FULL_42_100]OFW84861.1 MAG: hypothetical protein A2W06_03310 [Alphaproteobacteria bacterium RBG_16_42_14]OFW90980.1 MAG: hypothetical protein A3C41_04120 [Alphaproteobacteria bacterium RIFCSPHIGHO2_02_FULL_42_30]OFW91426.1 MAG: 
MRFNFYLAVFMAQFLSSSLSAFDFPKDEDTPFGVSATRVDLPIDKNLHIPEPEKDGRFQTLNQTGFMIQDQNPYTEKFIEFAAETNHPVLEIGAAYGITALAALRKGAKVIANDLEAKHLLLLNEQAPQELRSKLILNNRRFPNDTNFPDNSLGAILACRIIHFLRGDEIAQAIEKMMRWLVPGGRIFIIAVSPYYHSFSNFLPIYLKNVDVKLPWPGEIENAHEYAPHRAQQIPKFLHLMETRSLGKFCKEKGLNVVYHSPMKKPY